ncbi:bis(5'-nucleosyl)-tetraphosphatase (symmetrical) YqeK [Sporosarcina limicola]|uniref:bis(5'-nucleosyl)-tetraphosphatase (symmetrical) n=1 Tax=Sporosarcina limicola TaxID=34101 RepID=A0A927R340_9BACL|nr:bis(5'-nucleosyl)-tetraphosphatase (symmetrical) YqeK [Sporosarcina limicola]MBE1554641.1 putative HD superfamily hydrolase involved in NAD metabolism [Sporosarcina limicola]
MDVEYLRTEIAKRVTIKRYEHVLRVAETAKILADRFQISVMKAEQAALFHDIAKFVDKAELRRMLENDNEDTRLFSFHPELWHAPAGAIIARDEYGVSDEDILNAIRSHTTGRAQMSPLEKVIYVADMTEPGRDFPGVDDLREAAKDNLDTAMAACIIHSVQFLVNKRAAVYPDSLECYNEHVKMRGPVK